jgi:glycosyltransferase involved in cell wall biosynthesis
MISVLIPVFNYNITGLVQEVGNQLSAVGKPYEIVVIDDGSDLAYKELNRAILKQPRVRYLESPQNKGRIATRNELLTKAAFDWLLFLDADSVVISKDFTNSYLDFLNGIWDVVVGGRVYSNEKPPKCHLRLHWTYGTHREAQPAKHRLKRPYAGFMSNNFLIRKSVFQKMQISDELEGYGHEDTWMGIQLEKMNAKVFHIDNPVLHDGVEDSSVFLNKSLNSLQNLNRLQKIVGDKTLKDHVKLFAAYSRYKKLGVLPILNFVVFLMQPFILKGLHSSKPSLFFFDLYRLNNYARLAANNNSQFKKG